MTPERKAKQLFKKVDDCVCGDINKRNTKDMVILFCDEIILQLDDMEKTETGHITNSWNQDFWNEVKIEVEKL